MIKPSEVTKITELVKTADHILVLQADNPDGDSLGSALALEAILDDMGKRVSLYCAIDMPSYLRYLKGWDRVAKDLPANFDLSIIVDASTLTLFQKLSESKQLGEVSSKPCIVLDHHSGVVNDIPFAEVTVNQPAVSSTGELIYRLAKTAGWPIPVDSGVFLMTSILGDTQGLSNHLTGAETYRIMAELVELGVNRPELEEQRRGYSKMPVEIFRYKAELIKRTIFTENGVIAYVTIGQKEINEFSPLYNPAPLIQTDMLQTEGVGVAIVFKHYNNGRITGAIRCNNGYTVGSELAMHFGGGGHGYASGFKVEDGRTLDEIRQECIKKAAELIAKLH